MSDTGPYRICETYAEVLVALYKVDGLKAADQLLTDAGLSREALRKAASEVRRVGMVELADMIKAHGKAAKPSPPSRWQKRHPSTTGQPAAVPSHRPDELAAALRTLRPKRR